MENVTQWSRSPCLGQEVVGEILPVEVQGGGGRVLLM